MGRIARCWIADGFSKSFKMVRLMKVDVRERGPTVGVYAAQQVRLKIQVIESGDNRNSLGRLENEFLNRM